MFVDTAAWVALTWPRDPEYRRATQFVEHELHGERFVTTEAVLGEAVTVLRVRAGHALACSFIDYLNLPSNTTEIVYADAELRAEALAIFRKAGDQEFSYVDCLSFAIMRRMNIREVFTFDEDFSRFGFTVKPTSGFSSTKRRGKP